MSKQSLKRVDFIFDTTCKCNEILYDAFKLTRDEIVDKIIESGLKGRGGAGFYTGIKWKYAKEEEAQDKIIVCNADEGEPGTFKDRAILEEVPGKVLGGMALCAKVIGAKKGYIYLRGEYNYLKPQLEKEIEKFHEVLQNELNFEFKIEIFSGSGAYVCGEETALLNSMEGLRGEPRNKPPFPTHSGLLGKPTVVNNVETLVYSMMVFHIGTDAFKKLGIQGSRGSKLFSISGDTPKSGIYELEFGMKVSDFVDEFGDGDTKAVQVGGASGFCVPRKEFKDIAIGYQGKLKGNSLPTGGAMMVFNSSRSMYNVLHNYLDFFVEESCGQCVPCRVGTQQLLKGIEAIKRGDKSSEYLEHLLALSETMKLTSKCGLGQSVANSFTSIVENFKEEMIY